MYTRPGLAKVIILILLLLFSASGVVQASSTDNDFDVDLVSTPNIGNVITVIVVLTLIIGLIILLIRFLALKNNSWFSSRSIRQLGGIGLGQNKSVQIVQIGTSLYVVGVGENITLLDKIHNQEEIDDILQSFNSSSSMSGKGVIAYISKSLNNRRQNSSTVEDQEPSSTSFQEIFHSKMQQVSKRRQQLKNTWEEDNSTDGDKS